MNRLLLSFAVLFFMIVGAGLGKAQTPGDKSVVRLDQALDSIISHDARLEIVKGGFGFTEGINWVEEGKTGYLIFSDLDAGVIYKMTPDGKVSVVLEKSAYRGPNGLTLDLQGGLIICTYAGRTVERLDKDGKRTTLADRYEGKRFSGPNDVVVKSNGAIYFTDTFLGLPGRDKDPAKELDSEAIFMIKDGKVTLVVQDIPTLNGLAFSPDEKYLYANVRGAQKIRRYEVQPDGTVKNSQLLIDMSEDKSPGNADGMRVDSKGNIYSTGPGGIWIVSPDGKHLGTIRGVPDAKNLTFGDPDYKTLYIAARATINKIQVNIPGQRRNESK